MIFFCYKITNIKNNKVYIGKTNDIRSRWQAHLSRAFNIKSDRYNCPLSSAIRKYGSANFKFELITICEIEQQANECEKYFIKLYKSNRNLFGKSFGYNLTDGGEGVSGFKFNEKSRAKMSASHIGIKPSEESLKKRSKSRTGILHSQETKDKLSDMFRGENSSAAKVSWEIVGLIRKEYSSGAFTLKELSAKYNMSTSNVGSIVRNESWRL